jgi:hypothetical protein
MLRLPNPHRGGLALVALLAMLGACSRGARRVEGDTADATLTVSDTGGGTTTGTTPRVWSEPPASPPELPPEPPPPSAPEDAAAPAGPAPAEATITLQRTSCFGSCPAYDVELHADGRVVFRGETFVRVSKAERRIPPDVAQQVFASLARDGFWSWNARYRLPITDQPTAIVTVRWGNRVKSVSEYPPCDKESGAPPALCILSNTLDRVTRSDEWTRCKDGAGRLVPCTRRKDGSGSAKGCDPPWSFDAKGVKHYKPECIAP